MTRTIRHPLTLDARDPRNLRGDPITGERYYSKAFADREWEKLWKKIWHVAGRLSQLEEPGDYLVHDFMHESVIVARQDDGSIRAFYNACRHRGQRLVEQSSPMRGNSSVRTTAGSGGATACWAPSRTPATSRRAIRAAALRLKELRCDTWGGFVWYTMDPDAPALLDYLEPIPDLYKSLCDGLARAARLDA